VTAPPPPVSIIVPCWNAERFVLAAVLSALSQTYPNVEIIVVDDGSTDASLAALERVRDRITLISTPNRGACAARNTGLEHSSGEFIKFLDADDFLLPEAIERQVHALGLLGDGEFTVGLMYELDQETGVILPQEGAGGHAFGLAGLLVGTPVNSCMLYRRGMVEAIGGWRELPTRQDFDFFVRMVLAGYLPHEDDVPVYVYRNHSSTFRLSKRRTADDYRAMVAMYEHFLEQLARERQCPPDAVLGLGKSAWITARNALRARHSVEARRLFDLARRFDPTGCVAGTRPYAAAVRLVGPELAERLGQIRR
jgi:glycosyltransferase involved in cell wall biosynthesis